MTQKFHFDDDGRNKLQFVNNYKLIVFVDTSSSSVNQGILSSIRKGNRNIWHKIKIKTFLPYKPGPFHQFCLPMYLFKNRLPRRDAVLKIYL